MKLTLNYVFDKDIDFFQKVRGSKRYLHYYMEFQLNDIKIEVTMHGFNLG